MRRGRTICLAAVAALGVTLLAGTAQAARQATALSYLPDDALTAAVLDGRLDAAEAALERARSLTDREAVRERHGTISRPGPRDATLILRDLVARFRGLSPAGQAEASRILARPDDGRSDPLGSGYSVPEDEVRVACSTHFCVHWVETTADAPPLLDTDASGVSDYVEAAVQTLEEVYAYEVDASGYRAPKPDLASRNHGPDERVDVYLGDVGADGYYGYCMTDDPAAFTGTVYDVSSYCVLDDDYSLAQFGAFGSTGLDALRVTAAHEFFHAVQAAYDFFDDLVLIEGTATWMEDEVYDDIDDNIQYLDRSPLARPDIPFDLALRSPTNPLSGFQYGAWIFYRYLGEIVAGPELIRRIWEHADAASGARDLQSLQAVDAALRERGSSFGGTFASFAAANTVAFDVYEEGDRYPVPAPARRVTLNAGGSVSGRVTLDHQTSWYGSFEPRASVGASARLRFTLDLPPRLRGSQARAVVIRTSGASQFVQAKLDAKGDATLSVAFGRPAISRVVLVLTNASARYECWRNTVLACQGLPLDDNIVFRYTARAR